MSKKIIVSLLLYSLFLSKAFAQSQGIAFESGSVWKQIVAKAQQQHKPIFVDCYTDWCGPCYTMATTVFTNDAVGSFFNKHFISVKWNVETETDGIMIRKKYDVSAYPTMLVIDATTEEEVHRMVGGLSVQGLLAEAEIALNPQSNMAGMTKRYQNGDRDLSFLQHYLKALENASAPAEKEVGVVYLNLLNAEQLATAAHWAMMVKYGMDILSKPMQLVVSNREKFYGVVDKYAVDYKIEHAIQSAVDDITSGQPGKRSFNQSANDQLMAYLKTIDDPAVPGALAYLYTAALLRQKDYNGAIHTMREALAYHLFRKGGQKKYLQKYITGLQNCTDKSVIKKAITLLDEQVQQAATFYGKADLLKLKYTLQVQAGDAPGAQDSKAREAQYRTMGDDNGEWMN